MKNKYIFVVVMLCSILLVSFGFTSIYVSSQDTADDDDFVIVTSFYPMYIATMNVVGDTEGVTLKNLSEPQTGCLHDFQLTPADMKLLSTADVFVINGGGIESFMEEIAMQYPELIIIEACEGLELLGDDHSHTQEENHEELTDEISSVEDEHAQDDAYVHDDDHDHDHGDVNAHAWMSVELHRKQVEHIATELARVDTAHADKYLSNQKLYDGKLAQLQDKQQAVVKAMAHEDVVLLHCAFDYVAEEYDMHIAYCMDLDEERQISAGEVAEVLDAIKEHKVRYILAEELYAKDMCKMLQQEVTVQAIYLDPLTRGEYDADSYLKGMEQNIKLLEEAFSAPN